MADDNNIKNDGGATTTETVRTLTDSQDERPNSQERVERSLKTQEANRKAETKPAKLGEASPEDMEASGAIVEPAVKEAIDVDHPAVDNNPRAGTTVRQNQIDFNDPTATSRQAVEQNLNRKG